MGNNPWIDDFLSGCGSPDGYSKAFVCSDLIPLCVTGVSCGEKDYCCNGLRLLSFFSTICALQHPNYRFRIRWGKVLPGNYGEDNWWIDFKLIFEAFWISYYSTPHDPDIGDRCEVTFDECYNCSAPEECCFCEGCGNLADCTDLIDKLEEMRLGINCLAQRMDCLIEGFGQSQLSREYTAGHYANIERIAVHNANQISQALLSVGWAMSKQEIPFPVSASEPCSDPADNAPLGCTVVGTNWCDTLPPPA